MSMAGPLVCGGTVSIPGDPGALANAARVYAGASGAFGDAASRLRSSLGEVASWQGVGATAHAQRVQALAAAHEVGRDALLLGSQGLSTYARELADAQALARQANAATADAAATANQLQAANDQASTASPFATAANGYMPPNVAASLQAQNLQGVLDGQQAHAVRLGGQARLLAQQAATKASACFAHVASMAGNTALHGSTNPWVSYLGVAPDGQAAALIEAGGVLGGQGGESTGTALIDLAAAEPGSYNANLAGLYIVRDGQYGADGAAMLAWLRDHGVTGALPPGFDQLSPMMQAALLAQRVKDVKAHGTGSTGLVIGSDALHAVSLLAAVGAIALTAVSLAQGGADPVTDGSAVGADAGAGAASTEAATLGGRARFVQGLQRLATLGGRTTPVQGLNALAFGAGAGALGTDVGQGVLTGNQDVPQLVFDGLAVVPGGGALFADTRVVGLAQAQVLAKARLAAVPAGSPAARAALASLRGLQASGNSVEAGSKVLAIYSGGFGVTAGVYGTGAWVYGAADGVGPGGG